MSTRNYSPVFIIGTGRCGSTLLSSIINKHPDITSISEFFSFISDLGTKIGSAFPEGVVSASYFWDLIGSHHKKQNLMIRQDIAIDEVIYPWKDSSYRYNQFTGVPALLQTTLPHLTKDCDHFFDQIRDFVFTQNPQLIENHYTVLFNFIQKSLNNKFWVERSGGSLRVVHRLHQMFPTAKFIHIVRDGRDCAISMSKHYGFKMVITAFQMIEILGCDPYEDDNRQFAGDLPDELYPLLPEHFNRKLFIEYDIPLSLYGHYWSGELIAASETLQKLPQKQLFTIQYEQLLQRPRESLEPLMSFMHVETDQQWISDVCETIRSPVSSWRNLSLEERKKLEDACSPGFEMLKKLGSGYD